MSDALDAESLPSELGEFQHIADAMPNLAWLSGPTGRITYVNLPWVTYTGFTLEMMQTPIEGIVHPEERERTLQTWTEALEHGRPYEIEYRLRRASDKSYRWFIARALPRRDAGGTLIGWVGTATDIDDQRRAREALEFVLEAETSFSGKLDVLTICQNFADVAIRGFADWCFVQLYDAPDVLRTVASAHRDAARRSEVKAFITRSKPRSRGPLIERLREGSVLAPFVTPEQVAAEASDAEHFAILQTLNMYSVMIVPLVANDGSFMGALSLIASEAQRSFTQADLIVAERITKRAAVAIETAQRFEEQSRIAERLQIVEAATKHVYDEPAKDAAEMARRITRAAVPAVADRVTIYFADQPDRLQILAVHDIDPAMVESTYRLLDAYYLSRSSVLRTVMKEDRPLLLQHVDEEHMRAWSSDEDYLERIRTFGIRSHLFVPLRGPGGTIGVLALATVRDSPRRFAPDDIPVAEELAARTAFALDLAARHEREYRISQTFQRAALPVELPRIPGTQLSAFYEAGGSEAQIGGDWYDAFRLPDGRLVLSIGDVAGSGLDAAVIMGSVRQSIRTASIMNPDPRLILDAVDRVVRALGDRFVTAFVGVFDPLFGELRFASAGHPGPFLRLPDKTVEQLHTAGLPLGLRNLAEGAEGARTIAAGSELLFYTDGLSEIERDTIAGEDAIRKNFSAGAVSARGLFVLITGDREARDDVAMMLLRFEHPLLEETAGNPVTAWTIDTGNARAGMAARAELRKMLKAHRFSGAELDQAELVCGELIGNAVRHAPGTVNIIVDFSGVLPVLHVIDEGPGFELNPRLPSDIMSDRGRGLFIVKAFAEDFSISRRFDRSGSHARAVLRNVERAL